METFVELLFMERRDWQLLKNLWLSRAYVLDANATDSRIEAFHRGAFQ